jgi:hypothetical protein
MKIGTSVYLSQKPPGICGLSLATAMSDATKTASKIQILSAYYGRDYIRDLLTHVPESARKNCEVDLIFGSESDISIIQIISDLRVLRNQLASELGFKKLFVGVFRPGVPFHVKLYRFGAVEEPVWFVGSANASSAITGDRHEMMVKLTGKHAGLANYVSSVRKNAISTDADDNQLGDGKISNLRSFLFHGSLCFQPAARLGLTYEACVMTSRHRKVLSNRLARGSEIRHAAPQAEGFGFSLASAAAKITKSKVFSIVAGDDFRLKYRHLAVETAYGLWVPAPYAENLQDKVEIKGKINLKKMNALAKQLSASKNGALLKELNFHNDDMKSLFQSAKLPFIVKTDYVNAFKKFVDVRREWLADADRRKRLARSLVIETVPNFWNDERAKENFEDSFFEDLAMRISSPGPQTHICKVFCAKLRIDGNGKSISPFSLRKALVAHLKAGGWQFEDWPVLPASTL